MRIANERRRTPTLCTHTSIDRYPDRLPPFSARVPSPARSGDLSARARREELGHRLGLNPTAIKKTGAFRAGASRGRALRRARYH